MKLNGFVGKGSGKLGSSVFAISGGEQIVRQYNPVVSNPNTDAQVEQRAKLKLMSQLAAALAPGLAFKKNGLVSARNQFVAKNIGLVTFQNNVASVNLADLKLSDGSVVLPALMRESGTESGVDVHLSTPAPANIKAVIYVIATVVNDSELRNVDVQIVTTPLADRSFLYTIPNVSGTYVVYAYGLIEGNASASLNYDDYIVNANTPAAVLSVIRRLVTSGAILTKTNAIANINI